jgi:hypothetical protein
MRSASAGGARVCPGAGRGRGNRPAFAGGLAGTPRVLTQRPTDDWALFDLLTLLVDRGRDVHRGSVDPRCQTMQAMLVKRP